MFLVQNEDIPMLKISGSLVSAKNKRARFTEL